MPPRRKGASWCFGLGTRVDPARPNNGQGKRSPDGPTSAGLSTGTSLRFHWKPRRERRSGLLEINEAEIRKAIKIIDDELGRKGIQQDLSLIIVGAASLILKFNLQRSTSDTHIMETISQDRRLFGGVGQLLGRMGFHIVSEVILNLHPDYPDRLAPYAKKNQVQVFTLHPHDLAISKIGRGFVKDLEDIVTSDLLRHLDMKELEALYFEAVAYWLGDEQIYLANWKSFLEDYAEKANQSK